MWTVQWKIFFQSLSPIFLVPRKPLILIVYVSFHSFFLYIRANTKMESYFSPLWGQKVAYYFSKISYFLKILIHQEYVSFSFFKYQIFFKKIKSSSPSAASSEPPPEFDCPPSLSRGNHHHEFNFFHSQHVCICLLHIYEFMNNIYCFIGLKTLYKQYHTANTLL